MAISVGQGMTKSRYLKIFKSQFLIKFLRYGYNFWHVIITFIGFKITFSNIRSHRAPLMISRVFVATSDLGFKRVKICPKQFYQVDLNCLSPIFLFTFVI